jgi:predicted GIY-YIG superfamily endonuclease
MDGIALPRGQCFKQALCGHGASGWERSILRVSKNGRRLGHIIGSVYLIHFARALNGARHYLGFSTDIPARVERHKAGRGSPLLKAATEAGISWRVIRTWRKKDGNFERELKDGNNLSDLCPVCKKKG